MDPFTLLMAAQGIVAGIKQGAELLSQGKAQLGELKKAVGEVQAFAKEAQGLWATIKALWASLFGTNQSAPVSPVKTAESTAAKPIAKKTKPEPNKELSYEEFQAMAVHDICEKLKAFFEIKRQLYEHCRELEEGSKTTTDIEGAALDRIQIEMQLEAMSVQIREAMIYTPKEIGLQSIYSRFLKMYNQILEEREFDRQLKAKQARDLAWHREHRNNLLKAKLGYAIVLMMAALWMTGLFSLL